VRVLRGACVMQSALVTAQRQGAGQAFGLAVATAWPWARRGLRCRLCRSQVAPACPCGRWPSARVRGLGHRGLRRVGEWWPAAPILVYGVCRRKHICANICTNMELNRANARAGSIVSGGGSSQATCL
jgi:hypothetical protein